MELFGGAVFWCGGCFIGFGRDSTEKGEENPLQYFTKEENHKQWERWKHLEHVQPLNVSITEDPKEEDVSCPCPEALEKTGMT